MSVGPSHEVTLQRFKLLHLVQQVAKEDVADLVRTVGIEALTYRGTGVRGGDAPGGNHGVSKDAFVEQREHHRHVYRDFTAPQAAASRRRAIREPAFEDMHRRAAARHGYQRYEQHRLYDEVDDVTPQSMRGTRQHHDATEARQQSTASDRRHLVRSPGRAATRPDSRDSHPGHGANRASDTPAQAQRGNRPQNSDTAAWSHPAHDDRGASTPPRREDGGGSGSGRVSFQEPSSSQQTPTNSTAGTLPPQRSSGPRSDSPPATPVPKEIIAMAAQMLGRSSSRSSQRTSTQVTPTKLRTYAAQVQAPTASSGTSSAPFVTVEEGVQTSEGLGDRLQMLDASNGATQRNVDNAAVEARVPVSSTSTNTPPLLPRSSGVQTFLEGPPRLDFGAQVVATAAREKPLPSPFAAPEAIRGADAAVRRSADGAAVALHTQVQGTHARDSVALGSPAWLLEALAVMDNVVHEQNQIDERRRRMDERASLITPAGGGIETQPPRAATQDVSEDTLAFMTLGRAARAVDGMISEETQAERHRLTAHLSDQPSAPQTAVIRSTRQPLSEAAVSRLLEFRKDETECIRYNERLWNTSNVSQYVFADRLTVSLAADILDEVMDEVTGALDDYVEGLAEHELQ
jgi:hypothetical protein